jgi:hypothetical protein
MYNPPAGTGAIAATIPAGNNGVLYEAFTLSGVDTTVLPLTAGNNVASAQTVSASAGPNSVSSNAWAAVIGSCGNSDSSFAIAEADPYASDPPTSLSQGQNTLGISSGAYYSGYIAPVQGTANFTATCSGNATKLTVTALVFTAPG